MTLVRVPLEMQKPVILTVPLAPEEREPLTVTIDPFSKTTLRR